MERRWHAVVQGCPGALLRVSVVILPCSRYVAVSVMCFNDGARHGGDKLALCGCAPVLDYASQEEVVAVNQSGWQCKPRGWRLPWTAWLCDSTLRTCRHALRPRVSVRGARRTPIRGNVFVTAAVGARRPACVCARATVSGCRGSELPASDGVEAREHASVRASVMCACRVGVQGSLAVQTVPRGVAPRKAMPSGLG